MSTSLHVQRPQDPAPMEIAPPDEPGFWLVDSAREWIASQGSDSPVPLPHGTDLWEAARG